MKSINHHTVTITLEGQEIRDMYDELGTMTQDALDARPILRLVYRELVEVILP